MNIRYLYIIMLAGVMLFTACGKTQNTVSTESGKTLSYPTISEDLIKQEVPQDFPQNIAYPEGISTASVYHDTDTNNGNMVFFSTDKSVEETFNFYVQKLKDDGWTLTQYKQHNENTAFIDFQAGEEICMLYITNQTPKTYPEQMQSDKTFVAIQYHLKPQPNVFE